MNTSNKNYYVHVTREGNKSDTDRQDVPLAQSHRDNIMNLLLICLIVLGGLVFSSGLWVLTVNLEWGAYIMTLSGFFIAGIVGMFWLTQNIKIKLIKLLFASFLTLLIGDHYVNVFRLRNNSVPSLHRHTEMVKVPQF